MENLKDTILRNRRKSQLPTGTPMCFKPRGPLRLTPVTRAIDFLRTWVPHVTDFSYPRNETLWTTTFSHDIEEPSGPCWVWPDAIARLLGGVSFCGGRYHLYADKDLAYFSIGERAIDVREDYHGISPRMKRAMDPNWKRPAFKGHGAPQAPSTLGPESVQLFDLLARKDGATETTEVLREMLDCAMLDMSEEIRMKVEVIGALDDLGVLGATLAARNKTK